MLTDYHVHLRPDEEDASAARFFTAANAERYRTVAQERGDLVGPVGCPAVAVVEDAEVQLHDLTLLAVRPGAQRR